MDDKAFDSNKIGLNEKNNINFKEVTEDKIKIKNRLLSLIKKSVNRINDFRLSVSNFFEVLFNSKRATKYIIAILAFAILMIAIPMIIIKMLPNLKIDKSIEKTESIGEAEFKKILNSNKIVNNNEIAQDNEENVEYNKEKIFEEVKNRLSDLNKNNRFEDALSLALESSMDMVKSNSTISAEEIMSTIDTEKISKKGLLKYYSRMIDIAYLEDNKEKLDIYQKLYENLEKEYLKNK